MSNQCERFIGRRYSRLTIVKAAGSEGYKVIWRCECDCGRHAYASDGDLRRGAIKSCGREACEALAEIEYHES